MARSMQITFIFTFLSLLFTGLSRKLKWRKREVMELAAQPVTEVTNGFTNRPHPMGKTVYQKNGLVKFTDYCLQHLIAIPYQEDEGIVFVISSQVVLHLLNLKNTYADESNIRFDFAGNVSVKINKKDYLKFKDQLSFDQLCDSLGNLFIKFLQYHRQGQAEHIINDMNAYKFNPFFGGVIGF